LIWIRSSSKVKIRMTQGAVSVSSCDGSFRFMYDLWVFGLFSLCSTSSSFL
jgi:hypothetical protein